jgi:hypothetical protein
MFSNDFKPKLSPEYHCKSCDYVTSKKSNIDNHYRSAKHMKSIAITEIKPNLSSKYICLTCHKEYKDNSGLWRHRNKGSCETPKGGKITDTDSGFVDIHDKHIDLADKDGLIMMLIKQNTELIKEQGSIKQMMMEQQNKMIEQQNFVLEIAKNGTHNTTNSHNKAFNLNFFLNETCKDAMNIMDFVDSIKLQLSDLEKVGELGYVEGISNIIVKNLNELDVTQRPVHCTDKKRETMYIKDEDKWEKDENNSKIKKAIKRVASKNQRLLPKFKEAHPDCGTYHSKYSDQYNKIIIESVGGSGDNDAEKEEKIIRNISKNVIVEK